MEEEQQKKENMTDINNSEKDNYLLERFNVAQDQVVNGILESFNYDEFTNTIELEELEPLEDAHFKDAFSQLRIYQRDELTRNFRDLSNKYQTGSQLKAQFEYEENKNINNLVSQLNKDVQSVENSELNFDIIKNLIKDIEKVNEKVSFLSNFFLVYIFFFYL